MMASLTPSWSDTMSGSGNGITNAHCVTAFAVATCNGYAFKYDCINGSEGIRNDLNGLGKGETRIAYDSQREIYYFGCNGHVQGVKADDFTDTIWTHPVNLSNALDTVTSVVAAADGTIYAGANGYVYKINPQGDVLYTNPLTGTGNNEVRLALSVDQKTLFVGTNGQLWALSASTMTKTWSLTLPAWNYGATASNTVSVISVLYKDPGYGVATPWLFAGCNGWLYAIDLGQANPQVTAMTQSLQAALGAGDTRLAFDTESGQLFVGLSGCGASIDASLRRPAKWIYELAKSPGRVANILPGFQQVFVGSNGQVAVVLNGVCKQLGQVTNGGANPVGLAMDPAFPQRLVAGCNGYVAGFTIPEP